MFDLISILDFYNNAKTCFALFPYLNHRKFGFEIFGCCKDTTPFYLYIFKSIFSTQNKSVRNQGIFNSGKLTSLSRQEKLDRIVSRSFFFLFWFVCYISPMGAIISSLIWIRAHINIFFVTLICSTDSLHNKNTFSSISLRFYW